MIDIDPFYSAFIRMEAHHVRRSGWRRLRLLARREGVK